MTSPRVKTVPAVSGGDGVAGIGKQIEVLLLSSAASTRHSCQDSGISDAPLVPCDRYIIKGVTDCNSVWVSIGTNRYRV